MKNKKESCHLSEFELVTQLKKGEVFAFDKLFDCYSAKLFKMANSYLNEKADAEEIVQDVFIKIWQKRTDINPDLSFKTYLFKIAFNAILKAFRKKATDEKHKRLFAQEFLFHSTEKRDEAAYLQTLRYVDRLIDNLPPKQKEVFILSRKEGFKYREIALKLDVSENTVRNHMASAMRYIRSQVGKDDIDNLVFFVLFLKRPDSISYF